ncbi:TRI33-like protein, partial [Mya arenaria]
MATGRSSIYKGSDLIHDFSCSKCEENDFNTEAQHFCPDCEHYLCDKCVGLHNGYHNKHTVYGRGDVEKWVGSSIDKCDKHGKELDVHCDDHQELCCSVCVALNHSHLPDLAKGFQKKAEFKQLSEAVEKMRCRLDELKKEKREDQAELKDSYKKIIADFKALRIEIDTILDQIEKATKEQLDNIFDDFKNDVKDDVENCVKMNDQLKNLMEKINQLTGKRKETNSYIGYRKCTAKLTQADNLIRETRRKPKEEIQFVSDQSIESFFK